MKKETSTQTIKEDILVVPQSMKEAPHYYSDSGIQLKEYRELKVGSGKSYQNPFLYLIVESETTIPTTKILKKKRQ
jgi:hypothetical protein